MYIRIHEGSRRALVPLEEEPRGHHTRFLDRLPYIYEYHSTACCIYTSIRGVTRIQVVYWRDPDVYISAKDVYMRTHDG